MEKAIRDLFNQNVLETALNRYQIPLVDATMLDGFESFIFNVRRDGCEYILRIGHSSRRSADLIQGEAEFLNYLRGGGLSVPQVLPSVNHLLVEEIVAQDGSCFLATLFEKAPGHPPTGGDWCPALYQSMGQFMGRLHRLSKEFQPSLPRYQRFPSLRILRRWRRLAASISLRKINRFSRLTWIQWPLFSSFPRIQKVMAYATLISMGEFLYHR
jgi:amicoumacin kinase